MTCNQMKKSDLDMLFSKIDINNVDAASLFSIKKILQIEMEISLRMEGEEPHFTPRNIVCFQNCLKCLNSGDVTRAWWEMTDICSYKKANDFLTTDEVSLVYIALENIIPKISEMESSK